MSADGTVAIAYRAMDGNTSDASTHIRSWEDLVALTSHGDVLHDADGKLATRPNMMHIDKGGGRLILVTAIDELLPAVDAGRGLAPAAPRLRRSHAAATPRPRYGHGAPPSLGVPDRPPRDGRAVDAGGRRPVMISKVASTMLRIAVVGLFVLTGVSLAMVTDGGGAGGGDVSIQHDVSTRSSVQQQGLATSQARLAALREQRLRETMARYHDVAMARALGYEPCGECGTGGTYYVGPDFGEATSVDPASPQVLWFEPLHDGAMELVALKYAVTVDAWNEAGNDAPPSLLGRSFERDGEFLGEPVYLLVVPVEPWRPAGGFQH